MISTINYYEEVVGLLDYYLGTCRDRGTPLEVRGINKALPFNHTLYTFNTPICIKSYFGSIRSILDLLKNILVYGKPNERLEALIDQIKSIYILSLEEELVSLRLTVRHATFDSCS